MKTKTKTNTTIKSNAANWGNKLNFMAVFPSENISKITSPLQFMMYPLRSTPENELQFRNLFDKLEKLKKVR